ncbi:hypothetical protein BKG92_00580 [Rodentibacter ratti]|uniref:Uncharacterized protein n=1 Tax=Rodentibacter ratti TaxID=1906745 RepID=A0A1V3L4L6_9PAST|nr:hypothetical protein [Rodentibacter ratti]OOF84403.1 hypothetical protein BKG92_00580 [Rodentibacter ratti]
MKIRFFWHKEFREPWCTLYKDEEQIRSNLPGFLGDDEGLGVEHLKKWIKNGLCEIEKVKSGEVLDFDMWGQTMGAEISLDKVSIYCGDDYFPEEIIGFNAFYEILIKWLDFISSSEDFNKEVIFYIDMDF